MSRHGTWKVPATWFCGRDRSAKLSGTWTANGKSANPDQRLTQTDLDRPTREQAPAKAHGTPLLPEKPGKSLPDAPRLLLDAVQSLFFLDKSPSLLCVEAYFSSYLCPAVPESRLARDKPPFRPAIRPDPRSARSGRGRTKPKRLAAAPPRPSVRDAA